MVAPSRAPASTAPSPDCGVLDPSSQAYTTVMTPDSGQPGQTVGATGPTLRGEDGRYTPAGRLEIWWNTDVPGGEVSAPDPVKPGPVIHLATENDLGPCFFQVQFIVPDVPPGTYQVRIFVWGGGGYWVFDTLQFSVT